MFFGAKRILLLHILTYQTKSFFNYEHLSSRFPTINNHFVWRQENCFALNSYVVENALI